MSESPPHELLHAVLSDPDSVEPRLVLSDWFSEQEDPRGALISLQCTLIDRPRPTPALRARLLQEEAALLAAHGARWASEAAWVSSYTFRRGFIERIEATVQDFIDRGAGLLEREPVLELTLTKASSESLEALADCAHLARVRSLRLKGSALEPGLVALVSSPNVGALRKLIVNAARIGSLGVKAIADSRTIGSLQQLSLSSNPVTDSALRALAASASMSGLERLHLARAKVSDEGLIALATEGQFTKLRELGLDRNNITDAGVSALLDSPHLKAMQRLELGGTSLTSGLVKKVMERWPRSRCQGQS